jgi:hypothetical protein
MECKFCGKQIENNDFCDDYCSWQFAMFDYVYPNGESKVVKMVDVNLTAYILEDGVVILTKDDDNETVLWRISDWAEHVNILRSFDI